jgi:hypothetical protein
MLRFAGAVLLVACPSVGHAQLATVGVGALVSERPTEIVYELHVASPPVYQTRAYTTFSWTDDSAKPTLITAAERSVIRSRVANTGLGAGLLWLDANDYRPYPIIVSSTVIPLPIPRTSGVVIASTQPFQEWAWSVVIKVGLLAWFRR